MYNQISNNIEEINIALQNPNNMVLGIAKNNPVTLQETCGDLIIDESGRPWRSIEIDKFFVMDISEKLLN